MHFDEMIFRPGKDIEEEGIYIQLLEFQDKENGF